MIYGSELGVVAAVAALAVLLLLGPLVRALGRVARGLARVATAGARLLAERATRRAALGLLGSGAVLAGAAPAAAAPVAAASAVPDAGAASAAEAPPTAPGPRAPQPENRAVARIPATYVVVVGDCLWDIARRHLPAGARDAQVADAWPRWWAANRAVIGADPDLIHPGTRLVVPPRFRSTGTSTTAATAASSLDPDRR